MNATITSFDGKYRFLSNFWIESDGSHVEGEYQASKATPELRPLYMEKFQKVSPGKTKRLGRQLILRDDWSAKLSIQIMEALVTKKFMDDIDLAFELIHTGDAIIEEGNNWGDTFWGVVTDENGVKTGENNLGKILMRVRSFLRTYHCASAEEAV